MKRYIGEQGGQDDGGVNEHGRVRSGSSERSGRRRRCNKGQKSYSINLVYSNTPIMASKPVGETQKYTYLDQDTPEAPIMSSFGTLPSNRSQIKRLNADQERSKNNP